MSRSERIGRKGEAMVEKILLDLCSARQEYSLICDYTFRYAEEQYAQIDFLVLSPYGLFVFEVKNYDGVVDESQYKSYITQTLHGKTYFHKNPFTQNEWHTHALDKLLGVQGIPLCVFAGEAQVFLKRQPLHLHNLTQHILKYDKRIFSAMELRQIADTLLRHKETNERILKRFYNR